MLESITVFVLRVACLGKQERGSTPAQLISAAAPHSWAPVGTRLGPTQGLLRHACEPPALGSFTTEVRSDLPYIFLMPCCWQTQRMAVNRLGTIFPILFLPQLQNHRWHGHLNKAALVIIKICLRVMCNWFHVPQQGLKCSSYTIMTCSTLFEKGLNGLRLVCGLRLNIIFIGSVLFLWLHMRLYILNECIDI